MIECMNYVKIGFTTDIRNRLSQLQVATPLRLKLVALFEGDMETEKQLHKQFEEHAVRGEWFNNVEELKKFAEEQPTDLLWKYGFIDHDKSPMGLIKQARHDLNLSMEELGLRLGVTKQAVMDMETREMQGRITVGNLYKALNKLGYKLDLRSRAIRPR